MKIKPDELLKNNALRFTPDKMRVPLVDDFAIVVQFALNRTVVP